jgi:ribosomal protein S10
VRSRTLTEVARAVQVQFHKRLIDITKSTAVTMEALEKLDIPAGVDIEIKT